MQQALHQLQWSRSAERLFLKACFSSMQQALHQLQWNRSAERFVFQGLLLFYATSSSSAAVVSFSRKAFLLNETTAVDEELVA